MIDRLGVPNLVGESNSDHQISSRRLRKSLENFSRLFRKVEVHGIENLANLPRSSGSVFLSSHIYDFDLHLASYVLSNYFDLAITHQSLHSDIAASLLAFNVTGIGIAIAGEENFLPVGYHQKRGAQYGMVDVRDLDRIRGALKKGKSVIISAHNPSSDGRLTAKAGFVATRIAQSVEDSAVIPVATLLSGKVYPATPLGNLRTLIGRPVATVRIGEPMQFNDAESKNAGDEIEKIIRSLGSGKSKEKLQEMHNLRELFRRDGDQIMRKMAALLPEERRGIWK